MSLFLEDYLVFNPQFIDKILGKDVFGKMTEATILIKRKI